MAAAAHIDHVSARYKYSYLLTIRILIREIKIQTIYFFTTKPLHIEKFSAVR